MLTKHSPVRVSNDSRRFDESNVNENRMANLHSIPDMYVIAEMSNVKKVYITFFC